MAMASGKILRNFEDEVLRMWCIAWVAAPRLAPTSKEVAMVFSAFFYPVGSHPDLGPTSSLATPHCSSGRKYSPGPPHRMLVRFLRQAGKLTNWDGEPEGG